MANVSLPPHTEKIGTLQNDSLSSDSSQITFGLSGNDALRAYSSSETNIMVGGPGDDVYSAPRDAAVTILDSGGYDIIVAPGLGVNHPYTYVGTVEGKHLIAVDLVSRSQIMVANWLQPGNEIEEIHLSTGVYSLSQVVNAVYSSVNFLGNLSAGQLAQYGILAEGTTASDLQGMVDYIYAREAELTTSLSPPAPPQPAPAPAPFNVPGVDDAFYLAMNQDVALAGISPDLHFSQYGWREGRDPNALFDTSWYLEQNGDVAAANINPLDHYWTYGWTEGRDPSPHFSTQAYLAVNPDVALAGINPLEHWMYFGQAEGRAVA